MKEKQIGQYLVVEHENFSNIVRKAQPNEANKHFVANGMILVDEVVGKNHFVKACKRANRLHDEENPSQEKVELNRQIVAIVNKESKWVSDDYYLGFSIKELKAELKRLQDIDQKAAV